MTLVNQIISYLKEVRLEIKKVNWPTKKQVISYTLIVITVSLVVAIYLGILDFIFGFLLEKFILFINYATPTTSPI